MRPVFKWIAAGVALAFAGLQLTNPERANPPVAPGHDLMATNAPPAEVAALLHHACYDCHSSETKWPWYSHVAPVSWFVAGHVKDGREHLDFSGWPRDDSTQARKKLNHIADQVEEGDMPLPSYTWIHAEARLTSAQREQIVKWARQEADRLKPLPAETNSH